jgi:spore germination protein GerM
LGSADVPQGARVTASPASSGSARALVYLIHDGVLVAVSRAVPPDPSPAAVLQALLGGPSRRERDAGLVTAVTAATVNGSPEGGVVTVEVPAPDASSSGRTDEVLGFGQIVLSLTSLRDITAVRFTRDGQSLSVPRSDGSLSAAPLTRRDYTGLL